MKLRVHPFGENATLDYVVRLAEIIRRYESLVDHLLDDAQRFAYVPGLQYWDALGRYGEYLVTEARLAGTGTTQDAARTLGVSPTTFYVRAHRARAKRLKGIRGFRQGLEGV